MINKGGASYMARFGGRHTKNVAKILCIYTIYVFVLFSVCARPSRESWGSCFDFFYLQCVYLQLAAANCRRRHGWMLVLYLLLWDWGGRRQKQTVIWALGLILLKRLSCGGMETVSLWPSHLHVQISYRLATYVWRPRCNRTLIIHANVYDQDQGLTGRYHNTTLDTN